jgi:hypothetical protein
MRPSPDGHPHWRHGDVSRGGPLALVARASHPGPETSGRSGWTGGTATAPGNRPARLDHAAQSCGGGVPPGHTGSAAGL